VRRAIALALAVGAAATIHASQVRVVRHGDDRLTNITAVDVVVQQSEPETSACGLSQSTLQEAAVATLRAAGVKASVSGRASSWFYTVYVNAQSAAAGNRCVTAVDTELMAQVDGIPEADRHAAEGAWGSLLVGQMPLIRQSALVSSERPDHAARLENAMREHLNTIGARIRAANTAR
jgi:hypothetical protein